jgi:hypothetical protein
LAPESPKYLYSYKRFNESKASLQVIAGLNRSPMSKRRPDYSFDTEAVVPGRSIPILSNRQSEIEEAKPETKRLGTSQDLINKSDNPFVSKIDKDSLVSDYRPA